MWLWRIFLKDDAYIKGPCYIYQMSSRIQAVDISWSRYFYLRLPKIMPVGTSYDNIYHGYPRQRYKSL